MNLKEFQHLTIDDLNEFVDKCLDIPSRHMDLLKEFIDYYGGVSDFIYEFSYDEWSIIEAFDDEEFGRYMVNEGLWLSVPDELSSYLDYEKIGRDIRFETEFFRVDGYYLSPR